MKKSFKYSFILIMFFGWSQIHAQELIGNWQLVDFDGIQKIKSSPEYQKSTMAFRMELESKIKYRLENTVYKFFEGDSLAYTDFVKQEIVLKKASYSVDEENVLTISEANESKKAKILELEEGKLILEPISTNGNSAGKLIFERIIKKEEKDEN